MYCTGYKYAYPWLAPGSLNIGEAQTSTQSMQMPPCCACQGIIQMSGGLLHASVFTCLSTHADLRVGQLVPLACLS